MVLEDQALNSTLQAPVDKPNRSNERGTVEMHFYVVVVEGTSEYTLYPYGSTDTFKTIYQSNSGNFYILRVSKVLFTHKIWSFPWVPVVPDF